jgi:signal peptidase II
MRFGKATLVLLVLSGSVGCDQVTKVAARQHLEGRGTLSFLGDTFRLVLAENHGAFLGMGSSLPEPVRTAIFVGLVSIFLVGFLVWILRTNDLSRMAVFSAALVIGGGIGNLIDRVLFGGGVTDFMNLGVGSLRTGIFNVADVWIVIGAGLLLLSPEARHGLRSEPPTESDLEDS